MSHEVLIAVVGLALVALVALVAACAPPPPHPPRVEPGHERHAPDGTPEKIYRLARPRTPDPDAALWRD